jgi:hypothetical protein
MEALEAGELIGNAFDGGFEFRRRVGGDVFGCLCGVVHLCVDVFCCAVVGQRREIIFLTEGNEGNEGLLFAIFDF